MLTRLFSVHGEKSSENIMSKIVDLDREIDEDIDALVDFKAEVWEQLDKIPDERYVRGFYGSDMLNRGLGVL